MQLVLPFRSDDELATAEFPYEEIVECGVLGSGTRLLMGGDAKIGKSYVALQAAWDLATASPFLGTLQVMRPNRVLVLQFELAERLWQRRYLRCRDFYGKTDNIRTLSTKHFRLDREDGSDFDKLYHDIKEWEADVVVFDPLYYMHDANENEAQEMTPLLRLLDRIADELGCAVMLVHHKRKPTLDYRGRRVATGISEFRGSSVLHAWPDTLMEVTANRAGLTVNFELRNYDGVLPPIEMEWQSNGPPLAPVERLRAMSPALLRKAIELLREANGAMRAAEMKRQLERHSSPAIARRVIDALLAQGTFSEADDPDDKRHKLIRFKQ